MFFNVCAWKKVHFSLDEVERIPSLALKLDLVTWNPTKKLRFEPKRRVFCHWVWCVCGHVALPLTHCAYCSRNSLSLDDIRWVYGVSVLIQPVPDWAVLLHADPNAIFCSLALLVNVMLPLSKKKKLKNHSTPEPMQSGLHLDER